jgi:hypothetical protein
MSIEGKIMELEGILRNQKEKWPNLRLFLITPNIWLRLYHGNLETQHQLQEHAIIRGLKPQRGDILDIFSKIEFLVNELIQAKILGLFSPDAPFLEDVLENVDLFSRIKLLQQWGIIDNKLCGMTMNLKQVRNGLAHKWKESEVNYKGKKITQSFVQFKHDLEEVWIGLVGAYMKEQQSKIDEIITKLK